MNYKYCPSCGTEYRPKFDICSDCQVALVDRPPDRSEETPEASHPSSGTEVGQKLLAAVFVTGRGSQAETVRGFLEANGFEVHIWAGGMSPWRMEAGLTEMTGVPNDFNSYRVMVPESQEADARELLESVEQSKPVEQDLAGQVLIADTPIAAPRPWMSVFRSRWSLVFFAIVLLLVILLFGPPR